MRRFTITLVAALTTGAAALPATGQTAPAAAGAPEHECDRLAQPPRQTMGRLPVLAEGVGYAALRASAAQAACARAMARRRARCAS